MPPKPPTRQPKPQKIDLHEPISATLLRRIAEAADGHRGEKYWLVISTDEEDLDNGKRGHYVSKGHKKESDADDELPGKPKRHRIGPFFTPSWTLPGKRTLTGLDVSTSKGGVSEGPRKVKDVEQLDSLFWTESAIDKFLIPYYVRIYGSSYAADIQAAFNEEDTYALTHLPGSEYAVRIYSAPLKSRSELFIEEITPGHAKRLVEADDTPAPGSTTPEGADGGS